MIKLLLSLIVFLIFLCINIDLGIVIGLFIILIYLYKLKLKDFNKEVLDKYPGVYIDSNINNTNKFSRLGMLESNIKKNVSSNILVTLTDEKRNIPKKVNLVLSELNFSDVIVQYDLFFDEWHYILYFKDDYEVHLGINIDYKVEYSIYDESKILLDSNETILDNIINILNKYDLVGK